MVRENVSCVFNSCKFRYLKLDSENTETAIVMFAWQGIVKSFSCGKGWRTLR